ncbi:hypothetical protein [Methylobacterium oryzae]|uniref:hypothetical protein n=1 Tax=Methylobacterium oryzae TaxID=334852 RepID=UPI002F35BC2E
MVATVRPVAAEQVRGQHRDDVAGPTRRQPGHDGRDVPRVGAEQVEGTREARQATGLGPVGGDGDHGRAAAGGREAARDQGRGQQAGTVIGMDGCDHGVLL